MQKSLKKRGRKYIQITYKLDQFYSGISIYIVDSCSQYLHIPFTIISEVSLYILKGNKNVLHNLGIDQYETIKRQK